MSVVKTEVPAQRSRTSVKSPKAKFLYFTPDKITTLYLKKYFERTSLFWNFCVEHLEPIYQPHLKQPISKEADRAFTIVAERLVETARSVVESGLKIEETEISPIWEHSLATIMELPKHILEYRLEDLLTSYRQASSSLIEEEPGVFIINPYMAAPRLKNVRSTQSVRFNKDDFTIYSNLLTIKGPFHVSLDVPGLEHVSNDDVPSLTISRIVSRSNFVFGPEGKTPEVRFKLSLPSA